MSQETFWVLLSKKLSGEASEKELADLENLVLEHPEWQYAIQNLSDLWKHQPENDNAKEEDAYLLHLHRMSEMNVPFEEGTEPAPVVTLNKRNFKPWYWAAAAILLIASGWFLFIRPKASPEKELLSEKIHNEISTRPGSRSRIQLPDGSVVQLNAGSKLTYNKDFGIDQREVYLTGEGYFDVTKMKSKPFIIHTANINIKVLGTIFNVKAYPEDKQTETSLIKGSVEVTINNRPNDKIILSPNEKLVVENELALKKTVAAGSETPPAIAINKLAVSPVDNTIPETQWVNNKLVFRDESFADLALRMQRWFDVEIEIRDPELEQKRLSGIFQNETIGQAIEALKISTPFRYSQTGNKIIIYH